jgi:hypothetical protein
MEDNIGDIIGTKRSSIVVESNVNDEHDEDSGRISPKSIRISENPSIAFEPTSTSTILPKINEQITRSANILNNNAITNIVAPPKEEKGFFSFNPFKISGKNDNKGLLPDDDEDIDEYFRNLNESVCELPSSNFDDTRKLEVGTQIRIINRSTGDRSLFPDIYVISSINEDGSITVKSTTGDETDTKIDKKDISNIVNINPLSLHIDKNFLEKINNPNPNITEIKKYKNLFLSVIINNIDSKKYELKDSLIGVNEIKRNTIAMREGMKDLMNEIINSPNNTIPTNITESISQIKNFALTPLKNATSCYYIQNLNFVLDVLLPYPVYFGALNNTQKDTLKDQLLNSYIFVCECLSVTVIAGVVQMGISKETWIFTILNIFFNNVTSLLRLILSSSPELINSIIDYTITPALVIYLYTNMDTINFCAEQLVNKINEILSLIICTINYIRNKNTNESSSSTKSGISGNSGSSIISHDSEETLITITTIASATTFPSLKDLNHEYTEQINTALNTILPPQSNNSSLETIESTPPLSLQSQPPSPSPYSMDKGGKIKRSRVTKKYKRMTIRRSKRSKKMKGGKRTRSTKKRRVVRRRKHNTKKY